MKNTVFISLITAAAVAVAGGAALARSGHHGAPISFEALDTDADGQITKAEMAAHSAARRAQADTDGDGFLTLSEIEAAGAERASARAGKMMERLDANADGKLSAEEMQRPDRVARRFDRVDADGDGAITKAEFDAAQARAKGARKDRGASD